MMGNKKSKPIHESGVNTAAKDHGQKHESEATDEAAAPDPELQEPNASDAKHDSELMHKALVPGIVLNISSYLNVRDSVRMRLVNKDWCGVLPRKTVLTCADWHAHGEYRDEDKPFIVTKVGLDKIGIESIYLKITWKDQGWGNRKGQIIVKLLRNDQEIARCRPFGIAEHDWRTQEIALTESTPDEIQKGVISKSEKNDVIQIWRHVGGGGGHQLFIQKFIAVFTFKHNPRST